MYEYKEYTGLLFIALIVRYDPQIARFHRRNVRYDPRAHWDSCRYDHMSCPLRSLARFFLMTHYPKSMLQR